MPGIDAFTVLCLHCDGVDGLTTFSDASASVHTIIAELAGTTAVDTAQSKFGGASLLLGGTTGDYVRLSGTSSNFAFGTGNFVIDFWLRVTDITGVQIMYEGRDAASEITPTIYANAGVLFFFVNGSNVITGDTTISVDTWLHVAVVKSSGQTKLFLNGVQEGSTYTDANDYITNADRPLIGANGDAGFLGANAVKGWLDEIRVSKGTDRGWFGGFTPPSQAYGLDPALTITLDTTDGNGVESYDVASLYNGPATTVLRVMRPTDPDASQPHRFLYLIPVKPGLDDTFGDGLEEARTEDLHNTYNCTLIAPSFAQEPWIGNHTAATDLQYETFILEHLRPWVVSNLTTTGSEQHWLCSFSKGGFGSLSLIMRNPGSFSLCAAWDTPMDDEVTDNFAAFGADAVYGTTDNFDEYKVIANTNALKTPFLTITRLWISGDDATYETDVAELHSEFDSALVLHEYETGETRDHLWTSGWLPEAVERLAVLGEALTAAAAANLGRGAGGATRRRWFQYPNIVDDGQAWVRVKKTKPKTQVEDAEDDAEDGKKPRRPEAPSSLADLIKAGFMARRMSR